MSDELNISWHGEAEKYRDTILKNLIRNLCLTQTPSDSYL